MIIEDYQPPARLFKALMHPSRLAILQALRADEHCVCHLEAHLGCRQAYISQHLSVLREAGLVSDRRDGWNSYYRVDKPQVFDLLEQAARLMGVELPPPPLPVANCPCPKCSPAPILSLDTIVVSSE